MRRLRDIRLTLALLGLMVALYHSVAWGQQLAYMIVPTNAVQLQASTTSASVDLLAAGAPTVWVINEGTVPACVALGGSSVVATCPGTPQVPGTNVPPGVPVSFGIGGNTYLAAVTISGSTQLQIIAGHLAPAIFNPFRGSAVFQ